LFAAKLGSSARFIELGRFAMKSEIEKQIPARVVAAFGDLAIGMSSEAQSRIFMLAEELVKAVWIRKIYAALPADKTTVDEHFLDQELEQFLNEAVEESHKRFAAIAESVRKRKVPGLP